MYYLYRNLTRYRKPISLIKNSYWYKYYLLGNLKRYSITNSAGEAEINHHPNPRTKYQIIVARTLTQLTNSTP